MFNSLFKIFENPGKQIKIAATVLYIVETILLFLCVVVMVFATLLTMNALSNMLMAFGLLLWAAILWFWMGFSCCLLYAFGELVENSCETKYNINRIASLLAKMEKKTTNVNEETIKEAAKVVPAAKPKHIELPKVVLQEPRQSEVQPKEEIEEGAFVSGKTYHNGDVVKFEGEEYVCICESSSGTVWSPKQNPRLWEKV